MNNSDEETEINDFKETFILGLAHRLRTPLNGARWVMDSMLQKETGEQKELLREGYNKIIESINIVSDMLKSAQSNDGKNLLEGKKEKVNLCVVVEDILKNLNFLITEKHIELDYNKCDSAIVYGDKRMLESGLINIFDNAFRYSPKGKVSISVEKEGNNANLTVKDNGIGVSKDDMEHLFEKFFRGKNAMELDPDESGVGLYTTKKIIEMHKGSINIESELNKGTTIKVILPLD